MVLMAWPVLTVALSALACSLTELAIRTLRGGPPWPERQAVSRGWLTSCPDCPHGATSQHPSAALLWRVSLRGCKHCSRHFGWWHPAQQLVFITINLLIFAALGWQTLSVVYCAFISYCFLLCTIDWQQQWLPDGMTLSLIGLGLLAAATDTTPVAWQDACIGSVAAFTSMELIAACYRQLRGREGLGGGDSKLLAAMGAWFGWMPLPTLVVIASGIGVMVVLWKMWQQHTSAAHHIAFGPCLCLASGWPLYWQIQCKVM